jgi:hypothetical protein
MLVRAVVIGDQMQIQAGIRRGIDAFQELDPLLMPMPGHALSDHDVVGPIERQVPRA